MVVFMGGGFQEGIKDYIGKYRVVVIQMVVGYVLGMNVKPSILKHSNK